MTPKQLAYAKHRARGLGQERAAVEAGYAARGAKVTASRMERDPKIRAAIEAARGPQEAAEFDGAESYLLAVVQGRVPPDPVRVGAARALLPFQTARQRAPVGAARTPREMTKHVENERERARLADWERKAAAIRARRGRNG